MSSAVVDRKGLPRRTTRCSRPGPQLGPSWSLGQPAAPAAELCRFSEGGDRMKRWHVHFGIAALIAGALLLAAGYWLRRASRPEEDLARSTPRTIYVIQEFSWRFRDNRCPLLQDDGRPGKPVKAFVERRRADAH